MSITIDGSANTIVGSGAYTLTSPTLVTPKVSTTIGVGNATPAASGAGITFPATQSASSDANTLDDYEEGTFTPTVAFGGASVGVTYNSTYTGGHYTKVGRCVTFVCDVLLTSKGSSTGELTVAGFPYQSMSGGAAYSAAAMVAGGLSFANQYSARMPSSSLNLDFLETTEAGTRTFLNDTDASGSLELYISGMYYI